MVPGDTVNRSSRVLFNALHITEAAPNKYVFQLCLKDIKDSSVHVGLKLFFKI